MANPSSTKKKRPVEQYEHKAKQRKNNPPVGLVDAKSYAAECKKTYAYDPHLDPTLVWAGKAEGVDSGLRYKTVPHITLKSIANNEPPEPETLYDQPLTDYTKARVTGPFTVEAVPAPMVLPIGEFDRPPHEPSLN